METDDAIPKMGFNSKHVIFFFNLKYCIRCTEHHGDKNTFHYNKAFIFWFLTKQQSIFGGCRNFQRVVATNALKLPTSLLES